MLVYGVLHCTRLQVGGWSVGFWRCRRSRMGGMRVGRDCGGSMLRVSFVHWIGGCYAWGVVGVLSFSRSPRRGSVGGALVRGRRARFAHVTGVRFCAGRGLLQLVVGLRFRRHVVIRMRVGVWRQCVCRSHDDIGGATRVSIARRARFERECTEYQCDEYRYSEH